MLNFHQSKSPTVLLREAILVCIVCVFCIVCIFVQNRCVGVLFWCNYLIQLYVVIIIIIIIMIIIDCFYIALFSALEQTHCARM